MNDFRKPTAEEARAAWQEHRHRAGHIQHIFVSLLGEPSGYREIDIYDRRQMHEECPMLNLNLRPGPVEP